MSELGHTRSFGDRNVLDESHPTLGVGPSSKPPHHIEDVVVGMNVREFPLGRQG
jgi:hypothetical protein